MEPIVLPHRQHDSTDLLTPVLQASVAKDVLAVVQSKPGAEELANCLQWLSDADQKSKGFSIKCPGPLAAQIIFCLVHDILPHYWHSLSTSQSSKRQKKQLTNILRSAAGLGALISRLRTLNNLQNDSGNASKDAGETNARLQLLSETLKITEEVLKGDGTMWSLWQDIEQQISKPLQRSLTWNEIVSMLAAGRLLSTAAEADATVRTKSKTVVESAWIADGSEYSAWLGRNIVKMGSRLQATDKGAFKARSDMFSKALRLGHSNKLISAVFVELLRGDTHELSSCQDLIRNLRINDQMNLLDGMLHILSGELDKSSDPARQIRGCAALVERLSTSQKLLLDHLSDWLASSRGGSISLNLPINRAVIAIVVRDIDTLKKTTTRLLSLFGDKSAIQDAPVLHQETRTQVLLILLGALHREAHEAFRTLARSSTYINAISNRLGASLPRLQFLGTIVGLVVSRIMDEPDKRLNFSNDEIDGTEGKWYQSLIDVQDDLGAITDLQSTNSLSASRKSARKTDLSHPVTSLAKPTTKIVAIEEMSSSESEEDDLPRYQKPDSDEEDSDEDPTVINRNKPTAPVYIRDLLMGLRDNENYDRHRLAIVTAAPLIRRKSNFGTEVKDNLEDLATQLVGLKDSFDIERFQEQRLQAMAAVVIASPLEMGKWFSNTYFNGDYSMSQRAMILTTLALAARELAGYKDEDADLTAANSAPDFPSKRLPEKWDKVWQVQAAPVMALAANLERSIIKPMALEAADIASGPNILKVRTFSSRMEVEKKRKRAITNELAKIVADGFFFPLTGKWRAIIQTRGDDTVFTTPFLLSHFLRTLSLMLNASGTSTLSLPALTTEFWNLLLAARPAALKAQPVLEALMFSFLTLIEINGNDQRALAQDHSKELLETQAWTERVFENLRGGAGAEEKVKMLAAGLLVKIKEIIDRYQQLLLGHSLMFP